MQAEIAPFDPPTPKTLPYNQTRSESDDPLQRYGQLHDLAAILDAILNFSKCSRVTKVHPVDSEIGPHWLPKTIKEKLTNISRFSENTPLCCRIMQVTRVRFEPATDITLTLVGRYAVIGCKLQVPT